MKIECVGEKLIQAISKCEKTSMKHPTLPVLKCILFEAEDGVLTLKSTNLDLGIRVSLPVKVSKGGVVAVPGSVVGSYINNLSRAKSIVLETEGENLKISSKDCSALIKCFPHEYFPNIPLVEGGVNLKINAKDFVNGMRSVWYSAAVSSMKPELSSVYIYSEDDVLIFVATDSFRLAEKRVKVKKITEPVNLMIPFKNVLEIIRVLDEIDDDASVSFNKNQISFAFEEIYLTSRIVEGNFPDYKQIIPKEYKTEAVVLKYDFVNSLKLANVFSDKFNQININIKPGDRILSLTTCNSDVGENVTALDGALSGEDQDVNFNYKYIADCFQSINSDSISLQFNDKSKPMVVKGVNDRSFMYLVMPMNR